MTVESITKAAASIRRKKVQELTDLFHDLGMAEGLLDFESLVVQAVFATPKSIVRVSHPAPAGSKDPFLPLSSIALLIGFDNEGYPVLEKLCCGGVSGDPEYSKRESAAIKARICLSYHAMRNWEVLFKKVPKWFRDVAEINAKERRLMTKFHK